MAMDLIEIRDLDGPNYFAPRPVIKLEVRIAENARVTQSVLAAAESRVGRTVSVDPVEALKTVVQALHAEVGEPEPRVRSMSLDEPGHIALYFEWSWREFATLIAQTAFDIVHGAPEPASISR